MKVILTKDDVKDILLNHIFMNFVEPLGVDDTTDIEFNDYNLPCGDLVFEKKVIREVKLEDVQDMAVEQLKERGKKDAV